MRGRTIWNGFRSALAIISGKFIFDFEIAERLWTLRYLIFTGEIVMENGSSGTCFLRKSGAAGTDKVPLSEGAGCEQRKQTGGVCTAFCEKSLKNI